MSWKESNQYSEVWRQFFFPCYIGFVYPSLLFYPVIMVHMSTSCLSNQWHDEWQLEGCASYFAVGSVTPFIDDAMYDIWLFHMLSIDFIQLFMKWLYVLLHFYVFTLQLYVLLSLYVFAMNRMHIILFWLHAGSLIYQNYEIRATKSNIVL